METTPPDEGESLRSLDAQLGQLSATWDPIAAPPAQNTTRRGKWTAPECDYAAVVIEHFANGRLPGLSGGESLRATLAELLGCAPMRITKKLSSTRAHGKQCFKKRGELSARERVALESARAAFLRSLDAGFVCTGPSGPPSRSRGASRPTTRGSRASRARRGSTRTSTNEIGAG